MKTINISKLYRDFIYKIMQVPIVGHILFFYFFLLIFGGFVYCFFSIAGLVFFLPALITLIIISIADYNTKF